MNRRNRFHLCLNKGKSCIGIRYTDWTVLRYARHTLDKKTGYNKVAYWWCRCEGCGREFEVIADNVARGLSVGCVECGKKKNCGSGNPYWKGCGEIPSSLWTKYRHGAKSRGIDFSLTLEDMSRQWEVQKGICPFTGEKLVMVVANACGKKKLGKFLDEMPIASLDRIDNMRGYDVGNVMWVHKAANMMRNAFEVGYFISMCRRIAEHGFQGGISGHDRGCEEEGGKGC